MLKINSARSAKLVRDAFLVFTLLFSMSVGRGVTLVYSGSAKASVGGVISRVPVLMRLGSDLRARGTIRLPGENRTVRLEGFMRKNGKVMVKIATKDGIHGTLTGVPKLQQFKGRGVIHIPGQGAVDVKFTARQTVHGSINFSRFSGTYKVALTSGEKLFNSMTIELSRTPLQVLEGLYQCDLTFDFVDNYAALYKTTCLTDTAGDARSLHTGGNLHFPVNKAVGVGSYLFNIVASDDLNELTLTFAADWSVGSAPFHAKGTAVLRK